MEDVPAGLIYAATVLVAVVSALSASMLAIIAKLNRQLDTVAHRESETRDAVDRVAHILASPEQAWFWAPRWQAGEQVASHEIAAGQLQGAMTETEFSAYLDKLDAEADAEQHIGQLT